MSDGVLMLDPEFEARVKRDEPMSRHTSWHVGGPADVFFSPRDRADLLAFLGTLPEGTPLFWLGLGSNLLVRDGGIRGVVIDTHGGLTRLERVNDTTLTCEAGVPCARLARQCIKWGLGPAEFLAGIPGTLGGALAMNAGAFGGETWPRVRSVDVCDARGNATPPRRARIPLRLSPHRAAGRRASTSSPRRSSSSTRPGITDEAMRELLAQAQGDAAHRRVELRLDVHQSAGRPRRAADRSGRPQGLPHRRHHGFAQARELPRQRRGSATAADVEELVAHIQTTSSEKFGVALTPEFRIVGEPL